MWLSLDLWIDLDPTLGPNFHSALNLSKTLSFLAQTKQYFKVQLSNFRKSFLTFSSLLQ